MAAKTDFAVPLAIIAIGVAIAMPRILRDGPMGGTDWVYAGAGLGVAAVVAVVLVRSLLKR